jgi:hypothetical protein
MLISHFLKGTFVSSKVYQILFALYRKLSPAEEIRETNNELHAANYLY